jgi:predicted TIM-barrel fold metal-dependent hydrolase
MTEQIDLRLAIEALPLVDHHVHSLLLDPIDETDLLGALTEADHAIPRQETFDTQLGFAVRRHCAPILGLDAFASADDYIARRAGIGYDEVTRALLGASGITTYLIDGGYQPELLLPAERMMQLAGAVTHPIVRLETTAESVMATSVSSADFLRRLHDRLEAEAQHAIGWKTVAAYRSGLDLQPHKPTTEELAEAAEAWFAQSSPGAAARLVDTTIIRHLMWWALERGGVVQVHAGFGNTNLRLESANPAVMQPLVAATQHTGGRIVFLHCYPFVREAGFLAQIYPHVYLDAGLSINYLGANADSVVRETMDMAPFHRVLFSSDAWGLPELVHLGARLWRDSMVRVLGEYMEVHGWPLEEAVRVAEMMAWRNAETLYGHRFTGSETES